ncbi:MAG: alpha/beta hydrolase [Saccharofermentans sp.]|nr:alpha/beta hydrolase [Saccharofermentans sp.]
MKIAGDKALKTDLSKIDPAHLHAEVSEIKDIPYIKDDCSGHTFDVYLRKDGVRKPILIDIHGGGFISEDKSMNRLFADHLAYLGFTVFELNVRLAYPEWTVFDQITDIDCGVRFILDHATEYECDPSQMYVAGHSSGGVLAVAEALLCVDPLMRIDYGISDRDYSYKGIITDCGLMHFYKSSIAYWGMRKMIFPKGYKNDKRYEHLLYNKNESLKRLPRLAVMTNKKDILKKMTFQFDSVLTGFDVEHRLFLYGPVGHTGIIFYPYMDENSAVLSQVKEYFSKR